MEPNLGTLYAELNENQTIEEDATVFCSLLAPCPVRIRRSLFKMQRASYQVRPDICVASVNFL